MDQLRPDSIDSMGSNLNSLNTVSVPQENNISDNATTKSFDIENIKPENKFFTVDLMAGEGDVKFASIKTPDAKPDANNQNTNYINPVSSGGHGSANSMSSSSGAPIKTRDELRSGVKAALMVVDYVISLIATKIAGGNDQRAFTADTSQKKLLEDVVVEYLYGKQQQMPLWLTLTFAIAGSYGLILFGAIRQRNQINKNKKANSINNDFPTREENQRSPISQTAQQAANDIKKYQGGPTPPPPKPKLTTELMYVDKNKDGVLEPVRNPSYSDIMETPSKKSSPEYPDEHIVAESVAKLRDYVSRGIYPMFKKNQSNGNVIKIKYNANGLPVMAGKPPKTVKRK